MRLMLLTAVALLTAAAAVASESGDAAVRVHMECVCRNLASVDDGRSEAAPVAEKVIPICRTEHEAAMLASAGEKWKATSPQSARQLEFTHTLAAVHFCRDRNVRGTAPR